MRLVTVVREVKDYFLAMLMCIAFLIAAAVGGILLVAPIFAPVPICCEIAGQDWGWGKDPCPESVPWIVVSLMLWAFTLSYGFERATRPPDMDFRGRSKK